VKGRRRREGRQRDGQRDGREEVVSACASDSGRGAECWPRWLARVHTCGQGQVRVSPHNLKGDISVRFWASLPWKRLLSAALLRGSGGGCALSGYVSPGSGCCCCAPEGGAEGVCAEGERGEGG